MIISFLAAGYLSDTLAEAPWKVKSGRTVATPSRQGGGFTVLVYTGAMFLVAGLQDKPADSGGSDLPSCPGHSIVFR